MGAPNGTPGPTPPLATPDPALAVVAPFCLGPTGWRLFADESFRGTRVRSWKAIEPIESATGPDDPAIPVFQEASRAVLSLGYCAPVIGPDAPVVATETTIFQRVPGPTGGHTWVALSPPRAPGALTASRFGGAWAPQAAGVPRETAAVSWQPGMYVFRIVGEATGAGATFERWFGVVVDILPTS